MFHEELYIAGMVIGDQFLIEDSDYYSEEEEAYPEEDAGYEIVTWDIDEGLSDTEYEALDTVTRYTGWVAIEKEEDWDAIPEVLCRKGRHNDPQRDKR